MARRAVTEVCDQNQKMSDVYHGIHLLVISVSIEVILSQMECRGLAYTGRRELYTTEWRSNDHVTCTDNIWIQIEFT